MACATGASNTLLSHGQGSRMPTHGALASNTLQSLRLPLLRVLLVPLQLALRPQQQVPAGPQRGAVKRAASEASVAALRPRPARIQHDVVGRRELGKEGLRCVGLKRHPAHGSNLTLLRYVTWGRG